MEKRRIDSVFTGKLGSMPLNIRENYYLEELKKIIDHAYQNAPSVKKDSKMTSRIVLRSKLAFALTLLHNSMLMSLRI